MWQEIIVRLHVNAGNAAVYVGGTLAMALTCLFCWLRGERADRIGAIVFAACWMGETIASLVWLWFTGDQRTPFVSDIVWDTVPALVFLWLSVRSNNLWLGATALFQGVQFALSAADHAIGEPVGTPLPIVLILSLDLMNLAMMAGMIGSTLAALERRKASVQAA